MTADLTKISRETTAKMWFDEANRNVSEIGNVTFDDSKFIRWFRRGEPY
jgi:hypothetical protein